MKLPLHIHFHGMERSDAVETAARQKAQHLERFCHDIMSCRVTIDLLQKHRHQGRPFGVRIDLTMPGRELVVNRVEHEDVYVALRDAFDDMKRQLEDAVRQRRGDEKTHAPELHGQVVRLNEPEGYGFIRTADGDEYYFGRENLAGALFDDVRVDDAVRFIGDLGAEGRQAKRVRVARNHAL